MMASADFSTCTATRSPGTTPRFTSALAMRPERSIASAEVILRPSGVSMKVAPGSRRRTSSKTLLLIEKGPPSSFLRPARRRERADRTCLQVFLHGGRGHDLPFFCERFVIFLDGSEIVEVVDHEPVRLREALRRGVAEVVQPVKTR